MNDILRWWFSLADFFLIIAIHQIEMISFIKLFPVIRFFLLQLILGRVSCFCCLINMVLNFNVSSWFCVDMCWGVFLGRRRVVFLFFMHFPFCCCAEYYLLRCYFLARHLAAESGTRTAASSVYFISAGGGWFTSWGGAFPGDFLQLSIFIRKRWLAS